ncbi:MAG: NAD-dependent epimerase/dehydratase family protein [Proteobacteria bacterium]|nr:NAD-dependent epimerase/dehydratase family protein [Pseudomonadota bacterium]NOG59506.1 NAD-dependent epimerase/dehydratase family protein [Pseudomonadota bacterium]
MKTLVTGANGFIGSAVVRLLLDKGDDVRVLVRPDSDRRNFDGLDIEIIEGDLTDIESLKSAVTGCNNLYHLAADYRLWIPDPDNMYKVNVDGTRDLIIEATEAGVEKIVYTSSVATLGLNENGTPADESTPVSIEDMTGHYKRSKFLAEEEVNKLIKERSCPVITVNPSTPVGPRDIKPTPTGKIVLDTIRKRMPAYVNTGLNIVHVDDVARGHLLAMNKGEIGERYILGGDNMTLASILEYICISQDMSPPTIKLPHNLVLPIAWFMERIADITHKEPRATVDSVNMSKKMMFFSSDKAKDKLGYQSRPGVEGLKDAIDWFNKENYS